MSARRTALNVLVSVAEDGAYANLALKKAADGLPPQQARHIYALVYGTLDHLLAVDHVLSAFVSGKQNRYIRGILRMGVAELLYLGTPAHAAISECVALTREIGKTGLSGFVNAVLRNIDRSREHLPPLPSDPDARLSIQYSYPAWLTMDWICAYGETFTEQLLACPPTGTEVRPQFPETAEALKEALPANAVRGAYDQNCFRLPQGFDAASHPLFLSGRMTVQSESAMLACRALGDCRKKRVLDACAAPGGKSAYLYSLAESDVELTCWELHVHRTALLDKTLERLHVSARTETRDASVYDPAYDGMFDAVLLDAPCSGLGLLHEKPDLRYAKSRDGIAALTGIQAQLLHTCARYVRPGGVLLYATCTIGRTENEDQTAAFLAAHPDYQLETLPVPIENHGTLQLFPNVHGTDGFFLARMKRCI